MASPSIPFSLANSAVAWLLAILGLLVWMLFRPRDIFSLKVISLILSIVALGPVCDAVMKAESAAFPRRFDNFLYLVDQSLGVSAFAVARLLTEWQRSVLFQVYESLTLAMIAWYGVNLKARGGRPNRLLIAYGVMFLVGPCLYLLLPACGPRHAFGSEFPMGNPTVSLSMVELHQWPNAIPSLHVSTAILFVLFAGQQRILRWLSSTYLVGTILATLAFEHYVVDLIVAVPFAYFVARAAEGRVREAAGYLAMVLTWMLTIRYAAAPLIDFPVSLRIAGLFTVMLPSVARMAGRACSPRPKEGIPAIGYAVATRRTGCQ